MLVIGIDPGTAITGYGIIRQERDNTLTTVAYGVIRTPADMEMPKRLQLLYSELQQILLLHRPETGAVEKLFFEKNTKTAITVAQARGVALLALAQAEVRIGEYTPLEVKQAVSGFGRADKQQMQEMVRLLLGLDDIPRPDDAADALAVAITHLQYDRMNQLVQWPEQGEEDRQ